MKYISTRGKSPAVNFVEALFTGLAPDGGLYIPDRIPWFSTSEIVYLKNNSYVNIASHLLYPFVANSISGQDFSRILNNSIKVFSKNPQPNQGAGLVNFTEGLEDKKSYPVPAPLKPLEENLALLELFHGPTLAFKDFALQLLAGLMDFFLQEKQRELVILGATSGDTGSAAIEAFRHYSKIKIIILHPHNKITPFQRRQMTTVEADNVWNLAVEGSFDDCQQLVKECFNQKEFLPEKYNLTAINSINWARIMAQIVYYFSAFFQAGCDFKKKYCFAVPTGNFGNVLAGYFAMNMGLPINKLLVAVNQNDILHRFFSDNDYRITSLHQTYSPSMDILVSSNLERLFYLLNCPYEKPPHSLNMKYLNYKHKYNKKTGQTMEKFKNEKQVKLSNQIWSKANNFFLSASQSDKQTLKTIANCYKKHKKIIDPHTAVALGAVQSLRGKSQALEDMYNIVLATAHPLKFSQAIEAVLPKGAPVEKSEKLNPEELEKKTEHFEVFPNNLNHLKDFILTKALKKS